MAKDFEVDAEDADQGTKDTKVGANSAQNTRSHGGSGTGGAGGVESAEFVSDSSVSEDFVSDSSVSERFVAYISGEESAAQLRHRAERLEVGWGADRLGERLLVLNETDLGRCLGALEGVGPELAGVVLDSVQTAWVEEVGGAAGSVSQVRESALRMLHFAKSSGVPVFLVGHVTKSGDVAGPRVLEHVVDAVLQIEAAGEEGGVEGGEARDGVRTVRAIKNRFGATDATGVFCMSPGGLRNIDNPNSAFLSPQPAQGTAMAVVTQGARGIAVEIQTLTAPSALEFPRHRSRGIPLDRLHMLLAVLHRHSPLRLQRRSDVFLNVAGGLRILDPGADLATVASLASSILDTPLPQHTALIGEVALTGQLRTVPKMPSRLRAAKRAGADTVILPTQALRDLEREPHAATQDIPNIKPAASVHEALRLLKLAKK